MFFLFQSSILIVDRMAISVLIPLFSNTDIFGVPQLLKQLVVCIQLATKLFLAFRCSSDLVLSTLESEAINQALLKTLKRGKCCMEE